MIWIVLAAEFIGFIARGRSESEREEREFEMPVFFLLELYPQKVL